MEYQCPHFHSGSGLQTCESGPGGCSDKCRFGGNCLWCNVPFVDDEIFFGPTAKYVDETISLIPDFIANCGMARVFAYLMQPSASVTDEAIFEDVSNTIEKALLNIATHYSGHTSIAQRSLHQVLEKLMQENEQLSLL
jgi:hypothetical protein